MMKKIFILLIMGFCSLHVFSQQDFELERALDSLSKSKQMYQNRILELDKERSRIENIIFQRKYDQIIGDSAIKGIYYSTKDVYVKDLVTYEAIGVLSNQSKVIVVGQDRGHYKVTIDTLIGWVVNSALIPASDFRGGKTELAPGFKPITKEAIGKFKGKENNAKGNLQAETSVYEIKLKNSMVYKSPTYYSLEHGGFSDGESVQIIDVVNDFLLIKSKDGKLGYLSTLFSDYNLDNYKGNLINASIKRAYNRGQKIMINGVFVDKRNSASGIDFSVEWGYFDTSKDIKYIYFTVMPYNNVGDVVTCEIKGISTFTGKITGPIKAQNEYMKNSWGAAWYNNTISCIKLTRVVVNYMDGTSYTYVNELPKIINNNYVNKCN